MGAAVRYIVPQRRAQLLAVVGEDLRRVAHPFIALKRVPHP
jgi:hypothetical protein